MLTARDLAELRADIRKEIAAAVQAAQAANAERLAALEKRIRDLETRRP